MNKNPTDDAKCERRNAATTALMKRIVAFVKPNMLDDVIFALHKTEGFPGATISDVRGIGRSGRQGLAGGSRPLVHAFSASKRLEIVCVDEQAEGIVAVLEKSSHTGLPDDGKIYVSSVEQAVRIRTGERGEQAV